MAGNEVVIKIRAKDQTNDGIKKVEKQLKIFSSDIHCRII